MNFNRNHESKPSGAVLKHREVSLWDDGIKLCLKTTVLLEQTAFSQGAQHSKRVSIINISYCRKESLEQFSQEAIKASATNEKDDIQETLQR